MELFSRFLEGSPDAIRNKYPEVGQLTLINGEYRPNIDNFEYEYNFVGEQSCYKVVVNTFHEEGKGLQANYLVFKTSASALKGLTPIAEQPRVRMSEAYDVAYRAGDKPNFYGATVFLQWDRSASEVPTYWFLHDNSREWILVDAFEPRIVTITGDQPVQPA